MLCRRGPLCGVLGYGQILLFEIENACERRLQKPLALFHCNGQDIQGQHFEGKILKDCDARLLMLLRAGTGRE